MKSIYFFIGVNKYAIEKKIAEIVSAGNVGDLGLIKYDCGETEIDTVLDDCETLPFLDDKKFVIVTNPVFLSNEATKIDHNTERLISYVNNPNPATVLIINASDIKPVKNLRVYKTLIEKAEVFNFENLTEMEARDIIIKYLQTFNIHISQQAISELISRTECDALRLYSELKKIMFYCEGKTGITKEEVMLLVSEPLENNIFTLINYFMERKTKEAFKTYKDLLMQNTEPLVFSAILGNSFHNLYLIKQYQNKGYSETELRNILKIHPYQLKILYRLAQKMNLHDIEKNIRSLHEYDVATKTGRVDKYLGFELLMLNM